MSGRMVKYYPIDSDVLEFIAADQVSRVSRNDGGITLIHAMNDDIMECREAPQVIADRIDDCYETETEIVFTPRDDEDEQ